MKPNLGEPIFWHLFCLVCVEFIQIIYLAYILLADPGRFIARKKIIISLCYLNYFYSLEEYVLKEEEYVLFIGGVPFKGIRQAFNNRNVKISKKHTF